MARPLVSAASCCFSCWAAVSEQQRQFLFAPKSGKEFRQDIADAAIKGYDETLDAANRMKEQSLEYFEAAKEKGDDVLDTITEKAAAIKNEIGEDAEKISSIVGGTVKRMTGSFRSANKF